MTEMRTLIIIPTFNERENIGALIERLLTLYPGVDVVVVDDGSPDGTADAVKKRQQRFGRRLHLIERQGKGGRGSAVMEGCRYGLKEGYDVIMEMDSDFSHKPEEVALLLKTLNQGSGHSWPRPDPPQPGMAAPLPVDCVIGSRYVPGAEIREWGRKRTFFSKWANRYARLVLGIPINDYTNGFRAYTRKALEAIDFGEIDATGYVVLSEFAYQLHTKGFRFAEVPTLFVNRRRGSSNLGFPEINEAFFSVLRIRWPLMSHLLVDGGTFALRGVVGAGIDLLVLWLLVSVFSFPVAPSFILSGMIATALMLWLQQKRWGGHKTAPMKQSMILYGLIAVGSVGLSIGFFSMGVGYLGARMLGIVIMAPLSYLLRRALVRQ